MPNEITVSGWKLKLTKCNNSVIYRSVTPTQLPHMIANCYLHHKYVFNWVENAINPVITDDRITQIRRNSSIKYAPRIYYKTIGINGRQLKQLTAETKVYFLSSGRTWERDVGIIILPQFDVPRTTASDTSEEFNLLQISWDQNK